MSVKTGQVSSINLGGPALTRLGTVILLLIASLVSAAAQQQPGLRDSSNGSSAQPSPTRDSGADERYHIGPGDVLEIRVRKSPELSMEAVKVDQRGMIHMPMVDEPITAACLTEAELAEQINKIYLEYKTQPDVKIYIREYNAQLVSVIGAVNMPQQFKLQRRARLLEVLTLAGGPKEETASNTIIITHAPDAPLCGSSGSPSSELTSTYSLSATLSGDEMANPFVRAGDIIKLPEAKLAYVVGNVVRPSSIPLKDPITASRAIAMAGGTMLDSKTNRVRITRQVPGSTKQAELFIDLVAIQKHQAEDLLLQPGDIVEVATASGKRMLRAIMSTLIPSVAQRGTYVVR
jgi:polysaccharide export outer membrane protein